MHDQDPHQTRDVLPHRDLTVWEREVIERLLSKLFRYRDEIRAHLATAKVSNVCTACPTVWLEIDEGAVNRLLDPSGRPLYAAIPAELRGTDVDGMEFYVALDIVDGYVRQLQVGRWDGLPFHSLPDPATLELISEI